MIFLHLAQFPIEHDIETGEYGFYDDLGEGGIYMAFAGEERDGRFIPSKLLYIGKAENRTNSLGKRINEHGQVLTGKTESDHCRWRRTAKIDSKESIGYCYAVLDDMSHIDDIESKLIFNNQPICNIQKTENDCSSEMCPYFKLKFHSDYACTKGIIGNDTLQSFLRNIVSPLNNYLKNNV